MTTLEELQKHLSAPNQEECRHLFWEFVCEVATAAQAHPGMETTTVADLYASALDIGGYVADLEPDERNQMYVPTDKSEQ